MSQPVPRAVFDCMVYLQAAISVRGPAAKCLEAAENGQVRLYASEVILGEVGDVLLRPEIRRRRVHLTPAYVGAFLERARRVANVLDPVVAQISYPRDPDDEPLP